MLARVREVSLKVSEFNHPSKLDSHLVFGWVGFMIAISLASKSCFWTACPVTISFIQISMNRLLSIPRTLIK